MVKFAGIPLCLTLAASVYATPILTEESMTMVEMEADPGNLQAGLKMTLFRVDDLVNANGDVVAERNIEVDMDINVIERHIVLNGAPISIGLSNVMVGMQTHIDKDAKEVRDKDLAKDNPIEFGQVMMQILARQCDQTNEHGQVVSHVSLMERVVEVNHQKVKESDFIEVIVDVLPDGSLVRYPPNVIGIRQKARDLKDGPVFAEFVHHCKHHVEVLRWRLMFWWHSLPHFTRYALTFAFVLVNVIPLITLPVAIILMYRRRRAILAAQQAAHDAAYVSGPKVYFVHMESDPLGYEDDCLDDDSIPAYDAVVANQKQAFEQVSEKSRLVRAECDIESVQVKVEQGHEYKNLPSEDESSDNEEDTKE